MMKEKEAAMVQKEAAMVQYENGVFNPSTPNCKKKLNKSSFLLYLYNQYQ